MKDYMKDINVGDAIKAGRTDTICWDCKKAMYGGCSWTDPEVQKPVDGWTATKNSKGYLVRECPLFDRGTYACGMYRTADDYILALETALDNTKNTLTRVKKSYQNIKKQINKLTWQNEVHMCD